MKRREVFLVTISGLLLIALAACTGTADVFPLNDAARQLGPVRATFVRTGTGSGPVTMTMADGEVLTGEYRVDANMAEGFAFSGASSASALVITGGNVQFVATGPKTQMLCRGSTGGTGHGSGECQTYDGALWAIDW